MTGTDPNYPKPTIAWFAVFVMMAAYMFSFIDRMILSLLVEPIKQDLQISDVQISLLQGLSFALFYTLAGIPIGRLVDSRKRTSIIAWGVTLWCIMTAACAFTQKFWHLFLTRSGVGVGEAALAPAGYSLISDFFPPHRRGLAMGVFSSGSALGGGLALIIGGYAIELITASGEQALPLVGTLAPWRLTFIYVGLPGLIVALLIKLVPEPKRKFSAVETKSGEARVSIPFQEVLSHYRQHARTISLHHLAIGFAAMGSYGIMSWVPVMLIRTRDWPISDVGAVLGVSMLVAGTVGVIGGGWFGDWLENRGRRAGRLEAGFVAIVIAAVGAVMYPLQETSFMITSWFFFTMLGAFMVIGCTAAALLEIMPNRMRGQATAVYFFVISLMGIGAGPTVVAMFTDYVFGDPAAVRWSLMIAPTAAYVLSAICFQLVRKPYIKSRELIQA